MPETRGVIVPFRATRRSRARRRATTIAPDGQAAPVLPSLDPEAEALRNAAWDDLLRLAIQAWSWRDPDSLEVLGGAIERVSAETARDWQQP